MSTVTEPSRSAPAAASAQNVRSALGTPTWEIAQLFPRQGEWTEAEYSALETNNHLVELNHGMLEFLPMPTYSHAFLVRFLFRLLDEFVQRRQLGQVLFAPARVRISDEVQREPDVLFIPLGGKIEKTYTEDATLVVEVVSEGAENRQRDLVDKRGEYAAAGISEYWIIDPETTTVAVLTLPKGGNEYAIHGEFTPGDVATSVLLDGIAVDVAACFAAAEVAPE